MAALAVAALAYATINHGGGKMPEAKYEKVLVIGIDGMDPNVTGRLMAEGRLPNFKRLSESGAYMALETSTPPHSPVAWTSIATGSNPGKHNIFDFIRRNEKTRMPELSLAKTKSGLSGTSYESYVKATPFWRTTSAAGVKTTVIRWPVTFPPEEVDGDMLSGLGVPDIKGFLSGYTYYTSDKGVKSEKSSNRVVTLDLQSGKASTHVWGPKTVKSGEVVDVTAPMKVEVSKGTVKLTVDGQDYLADEGEWSVWMRAKFKVNAFKTVYGTFKAYVAAGEPLRMYVTAVQIDPENPVVSISKPDGYSGELAREIGLYYTLGMPEETDGYVDGKLDKGAFIGQIRDIEGERDRMFRREFERFLSADGGVLAFVYDSSDRVQHVMWNQSILDGGELVLDDAIAGYYEGKDKLIGEVLPRLDDRTLLLVISDHGFTSYEKGVSMNRWLVDNGYMTLKREPPVGVDGALFEYVDWSKTRAYSLGFNSLYVNARGREDGGIVEDRLALAKELAGKLETITDPANGKNVIHKAYLREEAYSGPYVKDAPDVIIGYNPGYRMSWQTAIGGLTPDIFVENTKKWRGDHLVDPSYVPGVLFSNAKLGKASASQMDVAPTILAAVGVEKQGEMDGISLI